MKNLVLAYGFAALFMLGCEPAPPPNTKATEDAAKKMEEAAKKMGEAADKMRENQEKEAEKAAKDAKEAEKLDAAVKEALKGITDDAEKAKEAAKP